MDDFYTLIAYSTTRINLKPRHWTRWTEANPTIHWLCLFCIYTHRPCILRQSFPFLWSHIGFSISLEIRAANNQNITSWNNIRRFNLVAPRWLFYHYGSIVGKRLCAMRIWPTWTHSIIVQQNSSPSNNFLVTTNVTCTKSTTIDHCIATQRLGIFHHVLERFIFRIGINIYRILMHIHLEHHTIEHSRRIDNWRTEEPRVHVPRPLERCLGRYAQLVHGILPRQHFHSQMLKVQSRILGPCRQRSVIVNLIGQPFIVPNEILQLRAVMMFF
mmetsp:Transcript_39914/g.82109  ORF Transcript_39914/g.82109 Transcript_39914/m.82109 type:complete len:272 (+) Transcript_39914:144-959(+)